MDVNAVMAFLEKNRRDIFDYANAVDVVNADLGNASGVAINFRYMGLDTDCMALGSGLKDTFRQMKPFLDTYFRLDEKKSDFSAATFDVTFNADLPVNETDIINNVRNSQGLISQQTLLENHPWVKDAEAELKKLEQEEKKRAANLMEELAVPLPEEGGGMVDGA